jgi:hypothetical protein
MPYLRLAICALSAFLVGCASSGSHAAVPFEASKYDFPANTVVRTETVYAEPVYVPAVAAPSQSNAHSEAYGELMQCSL